MSQADPRREPSGAGPPGRVVYLGVLLLFALAVGAYFVYQIGAVVLTLLLALLLAIIVSAPVNYLTRWGLGRGLALAMVTGATVLCLGLVGLVMAPTVQQQAEQFGDTVPALLADAEALAEEWQEALGLDTDLELEALPDLARDFVTTEMLARTASIGMNVASVLSFGLVALVATVYLVAHPYPVIDGFVSLFPAERRHETRRVLEQVYRAVQRWLLGQLVAMAFIGVLSGTALALLGVPFAVLLGLFAGLISFIPFVGPFISAIPPVLITLVEDPVLTLWVIVAYFVIQQVESQVIQPIVMSKAVKLHPAVVLFGILIMGVLFGIVGLLIAVPVVAAVQVAVKELWVERMEEIGTDEDPPEREGENEPGPLRKAFASLGKRLLRARRWFS
jgi:predicted PurR-regulated permease PerM